MYTHAHAYTPACVHMNRHIQTNAHTHICTCTPRAHNTHMHTHMYTHVHSTHAQAHTHRNMARRTQPLGTPSAITLTPGVLTGVTATVSFLSLFFFQN